METKNLSTLKIHKLSQEQYLRELEAGNIDEYALYLTPSDDDISNKQDKLVGVQGQIVGFDENGNAVAQDMPIDTTLTVEGQPADAKAVGDAISAIPQSDWDINDESNPAFIKNRPFYEETAELVYIPYESRTSDQVENNIAMYTITDGISEGLKVGKEYKVIIDGLEYVDVAKAGENWNYLGNADALFDGSFTQESPFGVFAVDANMSMTGAPYAGIAFLTSDGSPTHSFGITTTGTVTKTIDPKYLPEHLQFGTFVGENVTLMEYKPRKATESGEGYAVYQYENSEYTVFEEGKQYTLTFDGTEYICTADLYEDEVVIIGDVEFVEYPFYAYGIEAEGEFYFMLAISYEGFDGNATHSWGISGGGVEVVKIDKKYLPDDLNKPDVVIFDKGDLISSYENSTSYACTCTHTREELLEIYEKLNVNKNQENTPKIIARLITDNDGDVYSFINYSASQRTSNSVQFFFDYTLNGHNYVILAGYAEGSFYWTESEYDTESKLREKQNKTLIVTGTCAELEDPNSEVELTLSHTWNDINTALSNNQDVEIHVDMGNTGASVIVLKVAHYMPNAMAIFSCMVGQTLFTTSLSASGETPYLGGTAIALMAETEAALEEKQDKITGTEGQIVGFDENGNAVAQEAPEAVTSWNDLEDKPFYQEETWAFISDTFSGQTLTVIHDEDKYSNCFNELGRYRFTINGTDVYEYEKTSSDGQFVIGDNSMQTIPFAIRKVYSENTQTRFQIVGTITITSCKAEYYTSSAKYLDDIYLSNNIARTKDLVGIKSPFNGEVFNDLENNSARAIYSHAEGKFTTAVSQASHAEGWATIAQGDCSHAEGSGTSTDGLGSHAEGCGTRASGQAQHVEGQYNIESVDFIHIVGNGTDAALRSNAHTLKLSGEAWFAGDVYVGSTSGTNKDEGSVKLAKEITMTGSTSTTAGSTGLVPSPSSGDQDKFLRGDGKWADIITEDWVFTLEDGSTVTKKVRLG